MSANDTRHSNVAKTGFATRAIHHGYDPQSHNGALNPPVYMSSTFAFETAEQGGRFFAGDEQGFIYSRISNPTLDLLEKRLAVLEGGEAALATASGMGAITSVCWTFIEPGDEIIVDRTLYGCTFAYFRHGLEKFGIKHTHVDLTDPAELEKAISDKTKIVYFETPANPNMRLVDIAAISEIAHKHGAKVVVDNTYCTPYLQRPIELGADIVVHSATKYLGGHGDLMAGAVIGSLEDMTQVRLVGLKDMTGAVLSAQDANLVMRGLKTLELRMERHCDNAEKIAAFLGAHPKVDRVYYPGLESFAQHDLAKKQMDRFGGMIAFELKGGIEAGRKLMNGLNMITRAVSLGDAETLIQHPASMTHSTYTAEERAEYQITDGLIRLSAGLESIDDILADLANALDGGEMAIAAE
ncbi:MULTISPECIES: methionine gamma-lyase [Thalassospira]|uniref:L-methionine gamma-lyase n=3 Tax=Thalassospira TaxID=168934 RepID=A0A367WCX0_9PROT|nr:MULTISPECIES: methionine gamma-lyase [Thalassospira]MDG4717413.1 methionine gamma-lyase [Thalassospira sp. FZY0004]RCK39109.1 methionine gamma-lyase [Thalassospira profundimaris]